MKILLVGDFSGLYSYLKQGLQLLGQDVFLLADGDYWKKIPGADAPLYGKRTGNNTIISYILSIPTLIKTIHHLNKYDVIQIINTTTLYRTNIIGRIVLKKLKNKTKILALSAAGADYYQYKIWHEKKFRYNPFDGELPKVYKNKLTRTLLKYFETFVVKSVDEIIPNTFIYAEAYRFIPNSRKTIPFPINIDNISYQKNIVHDRIIFFHGVNREGDKGTKFIRDAMNIIQKKYPDQVDCIINGHLPFEEYTKIMGKTNVVIDQCLSYGYGINACIAMAQGKVVMSGFEPEALTELEIESCPGINILPEVGDIVSKMEWIIQHKEEIPKIGLESRKYIEEHHHYVKIAQRYIDIWMEKKQ